MDQNDLEREVFGSDSDLSDLDEAPVARPRVSHSPPAEDFESSGDSGDDYVQQEKVPKPKRRVSKRTPSGNGEPKKVARKRKRKQQLEDIDLSQLPPEQASKVRLNMQIEAILKPKKASKPRRKKKDDEDVLDRAADEEVSRLREAMLAAVADDEQANREKLPATAKLRLLPQVMEILRKTALAQSIIDNNLLEAVGKWLEPLPDRSLPALDIQKEFFPMLRKMEFIDTNVLKEARIGRVVIFYTKCKRVTPDIQRQANDMVSAWSRPIIKRSASYRDRIIPTAQLTEADVRSGERLNAILARARESDKNRTRKNAVMIPQRELGTYTVAPTAMVGKNTAVDIDIERRKKNAERLRSLTRKVATRG